MNIDSVQWHAHARVDKFTLDQVLACQLALGLKREPISHELLMFCSPDDFIEAEGNLLTRQGKKRLMDRLLGTASNQALDATHCRIGVGDSSASAIDTQTDLQATTNKYFKLVDSAPSVGTGASAGVGTFVATFGTTVGNFVWNEWGIDGGTGSTATVTADTNATPGLINRKVTALGTKTASAVWVFTVTITLS